MSARRWALALAGAAAAVAATSRCSLITGNFTECGNGLPPCPSGRACDARGYCVVVPEVCLGLPDAGVLSEYGSDAGDAIRLGLIFNFTNGSGVVNASRVQQLNAALLALDEINQRGVGGGRRFAYQVCDTASDTALARTQAHWMADLKGIKAPDKSPPPARWWPWPTTPCSATCC